MFLIKAFAFLIVINQAISKSTKMVLVLARHGARYGFAEVVPEHKRFKLTQNGLRMSYLLGKYIKEEFKSFFPKKFVYSENQIIASSPQRTKLSAQAIMLGIYDAGSLDESIKIDKKFWKPQWKDLQETTEILTPLPEGYQPIPISSFHHEDNYVMNAYDSKMCPKIISEESKRHDVLTRNLLRITNSILVRLRKTSFDYTKILDKESIENFTDLDALADFIICQRYQGDDMGISEDFYQEILKVQTMQIYASYFRSRELSTYLFTEMAQEIVSKFKAAQEGLEKKTVYPKFVLFAGHDLNLYNFLILANKVGIDCLSENSSVSADCTLIPPFSSSIIFELFKEGDKLFVEVKFNGSILKLCGTENACSFDEFIKFLEGMILPGATHELRKKYCLEPTATKHMGLKIFLGVNVFIVFVLIVIVLVIKKKKHRV